MMSPEPASPDNRSTAPRRRWRHTERLLWLGLFAVVIVMQWPMLKGWYYRTADAVPPAASFEWGTSLEAGLAQAKRDGRPVFVDFQASWCPPCIAMQHDVWPDARVGRLLTERYVAVTIDVDHDPEGASARYDVRAIPTILILAPDGQVLERATYMSRGAMVRFLEEHAGPVPSSRAAAAAESE
jgi:thiol:disulfide interchange protein